MPRFDAQRLLRPATSLPGGNQKIAEPAVGNALQDVVKFFLGNDSLALAGLGLLHVGNRVAVDVAKSLGPPHGPLNRAAIVALRSGRQAIHPIDPFLDVIRTQFRRGKRRILLGEALQASAIPLVGVERAVHLAPIQVGVDDADDRIPANNSCALRRVGHQFMELIDSCRFIGPQIMSLASDRDKPTATGLPVPGLRGTSHSKTSKLETVSKNHPAQA